MQVQMGGGGGKTAYLRRFCGDTEVEEIGWASFVLKGSGLIPASKG